MTRYRIVDTVLGPLVLSGDGALAGVWFDPHRGASPVGEEWKRDDDAFGDAVAQLDEYLDGRRRAFDLETNPGGTPFQRRVWSALLAIPYGDTRTYASLALELDTSARAVGSANARNPLSIVVPCHRLVGSAGLTGYAGGVERKRWLLDLESPMAGKVGSSSLQT